VAVPQGFKPSLSSAQVNDYRRLYERQPDKFDENTVQALEQHAEYYKLPFAESNKSFTERIGGVVKQAGAGFVEGFTTLNISDDAPDGDAEAIARNVGHLAGFVGYLPSFGIKSLAGLKYLKNNSAPMYVARKAQEKVNKIYKSTMGEALKTRAAASSTATKFLQNEVVKDMAGGAFHLGVASAVSSWRYGVDEMMSSFVHGAGTGAVFRFIGNKVSTGTDSKVADNALRALSASLFTGLPSTVRGDTTPMQVYQYLLGAYFGANEAPYSVRKSGQFLNKMRKAELGPKENRPLGDPNKVEGFSELDAKTQDLVIEGARRFNIEQPVTRELQSSLAEKGRALSEKEIEAEIKKFKKGELEVETTKEGEPLIVKKEAKSSYKVIREVKPPKAISESTFTEYADQGMARETKASSLKESIGESENLEIWSNIADANISKVNIKEAQRNINFIKNVIIKDKSDITGFETVGKFGSKRVKYSTLKEKIKDAKQAVLYLENRIKMLTPSMTPVLKIKKEASFVTKIISGGQTGGDQGGLQAGKILKIETGGTAPPGWKTESGSQKKLLESFGLKEGESDPSVFIKRTKKNVDDADGTIAFSLVRSAGTDKTIGYAQTGKWKVGTGSKNDGHRPILVLENALNNAENVKKIRDFISENDIKTLNIAGHREKTIKGLQESVKKVLVEALAVPKKSKEVKPPKNPEVIETNNTLDDIDPQNIPDRMSATAYTFISNPKYMRKDLEKLSPNDTKVIMEDISSAWIESIKKGKAEDINPGKLMIEHIESKYPTYDMDSKSENFWLSTGTRRQKDSPVKMIGTLAEGGYIKETYIMEADENGSTINNAGNRKFLAQEKKRMDRVYENDFKEAFPDKKVPDYSYSILDNIVIKTKAKNFQEKSLTQYKEYLRNFYKKEFKENQLDQDQQNSVIDNRYYREIGTIMKNMQKEDSYYFGGRGDAQRMYFAKFHPKSLKNNIGILKDIVKLKLSNKEKTDLDLDRQDFVKRYKDSIGEKEAKALFNKSFISNLYYSLRMNGFKGEQAELSNFRTLLNGDKYVTTGKSYNKRAQIWSTNGYSADAEAVRNTIENYKGIGKSDLVDVDGVLNARVIFIKDNGKSGEILNDKSAASKWPEGTDGHIGGRKDFIEGLNKGSGLDISGNVNKSFIVSPDPKLGAVLGKYMIHGNSAPVEAYANKESIHLIIPESSAKQLGERKIGELDISKKGEVTFKGEKPYLIPVKDLKVVLSEITNADMVKDKHIVKQMFTNQSPFGDFNPDVLPKELQTEQAYQKKVSETMSDMYYHTVHKRVQGEEKYNKMIEQLSNDPKKYQNNIDTILENIDRVGLDNLFIAAKKEGNELFANRLYSKLQNRDIEVIDRVRTEGEETSEQSNQRLLDINDYSSVPKRIQELAGESLAGHLFKWSTDHRTRVVQNFISDAITRPIIGNSGKARIRQYDKGLQYGENTKRLETENDIFFADNLWKAKVIDGTGLNLPKTTLESHFKKYTKLKKNNIESEKIKAYEELFETIVVRVPMDAMSGARTLKFAGFTNIDGAGVLMHGKVVRALGGADLDGDTSFIFFGGMNKEGKGSGFKKEWKDMYKWNEKEFEDANGVELDAKKTWESTFTEPKNERVSNNDLLTFSPYTRQIASEKAYEGRKELGPVVTGTAYMKSAHAAISSYPDKKYTVKNARVETKDGKETFYNLEITANTDRKSINTFNSMSKAATGFASDPMDYNGLNITKNNNLFNRQADTLFNYKLVNDKGISPKKRVTTAEKRLGPINTITNINQAIYSKNWATDRKWEPWEIQNKLDLIDNSKGRIENENRNTFLSRIPGDIKNIDWTDSIISRVSRANLIETIKKHNSNRKSNKWLYDILKRDHGVPIQNTDYILNVMNKELHTFNGMTKETTEQSWNKNLLDVKVEKGKKDPFEVYKTIVLKDDRGNIVYGKNGKPVREKDIKYYREESSNKENKGWRSRVLNDIVKKANDFIIQDYGDVNSTNRLLKSGSKIPKERASNIYEVASGIKKSSYLHQKMKQEYAQNLDPELMKEVSDKILSQFEVDSQIKTVKSKLKNQKEIDFFEDAMLSTIWYNSIKTGLSKLGFSSPEISDKAIQRWLGGYDKLFSSSDKVSEPDILPKALKTIDLLEKPQEIKDSEGTTTTGDFLETPLLDKPTRKYLNELAPFQYSGKKKIKSIDELPKEDQSLYYKLHNLFENYIPNWTAIDINKYARGLFGKDLNMANKEDLQFLAKSLESFKDGTWWQRVMRPVKDNLAKLSPTHYYMFPRAVGEDLMRYDLQRFQEIRQFSTRKHGTVLGEVYKPTNQINNHQQTMHYMDEQSTQKYRKISDEYDKEIGPYQALEKGDSLYKFSVMEAEMIQAKETIKAAKEFVPGQKRYIEDYDQFYKKIDWDKTQNEIFNVNKLNKEGEPVILKMTGREVVNAIDKIQTRWAKKSYAMTTGNPKELDGDYAKTEGSLPVKTGFDLIYRKILDKNGKPDSKLMVDKFVEEINRARSKGEDIDYDYLGIDGARELSREQVYVNAKFMGNKELGEAVRKFKIYRTSHIPFKYHYPHIVRSNPRLAKEYAKEQIKIINDNPKLSHQEKENATIKQLIRMHKSTGDYAPTLDITELGSSVDSAIKAIRDNKVKQDQGYQWLTSNKIIGSQHRRTSHLGGYDISPEAYKMYLKQIVDAQYQHAAQIKMRHDLYKWKEWAIKTKKADSDPEAIKWMDNWENYQNLYIQQGMGHPSHIPEHVLKNPDMKMKGTLYAWWSDMNVKKKVDKIYDKLGIKREDRMLPDELKGISYQDIAKWSNVEAKFELASLLAHPKSMMANFYGGSANTLVSTGFKNFLNARNPAFLQANVNPKFKRMGDWQKWINDLGVVEEFMIGEFGRNPRFASTKWKSFFEDAVKKIAKNPEMKDQELMSIVKKHGINTSIFNKAAWFMRRAERTLRRDSFLAHYLQAKTNLEGAIKKFDDPALIAYAKKGVQATQFLYSAPFRPMFAATSLGKVMTRFQIWAWNSVRFRKDIMKEASHRGYKEGTVEFDRFKRLMLADAFMFAMSSVFAYSLFEAALPAPLNWFQDTADWLFGDETERDRAFFGTWPSQVAPLQMVTPPGLRLAPAIFKGLVENDWERFANYYVWTMFPFGRIARDIAGKGGIIENPARTVEKVSGIPYMQFNQFYKKEPVTQKLGPGGIIRLKKDEGEQDNM